MPVIEKRALAWDYPSRDDWRGSSGAISKWKVLLAAGAGSPSFFPESSSMQQPSEPTTAPQPQAGPHSQPKAKKRVLVVEDDPSSRSALQFLLSNRGWDVMLANNLAEAFNCVRANLPDSIVLDLMLPDGDGTLLLEQIHRDHPAIPVAVTTGVLDAAWLKRVREFKPVCVLQKPILLSELVKVI
jgi:CheY-like chemotaxis protein